VIWFSLAAVVAQGVWAPGRRALTTGLVLSITLVATEALAVATVMPLVERDLGDLALYGWVFSGFFLGSLVGIVVGGRAADRMAPWVPFTLGLVLFAIGLALGGSAPSMPVLVAARLVQGLGAGAIPAVGYAVIGRSYPPEARPRMFALLSTAWVVPALVGPGLAVVVGEHVGWRWVFLGLLPFVVAGGALAVASVRRLPGPPEAVTGKTSLPDALLVAGGAALLLAGLGNDRVWLGALLAVAGLALGLPAFARLTPPGTLRAVPGLPAAVLIRGVLTFSFFVADAFVPLALVSVRGAGAAIGGIALTVSSLTWATGAWIQERRIRVTGPRPLVGAGFAILAGAAGLFLPVLFPGVPVVVGVVAWALAGLGIGLAYPTISVTVLGAADPGQEGTASAAVQLSDTLGIALGSGVGGVLVALGEALDWAPRSALVLVFVVSLTTALTGVVLSRRLPALVASAGER